MCAPAPNTTMTFLFTDIEGSTRQWEQSTEMRARVDDHFAVLSAAVEQAGGEIFSTMGDGIAAAFPSAEAAVHAAVESQRRMPTTGLRVRMGIHTGEVERVDDDFRGRPVNRAARIMAVGHGGQILLSDVSAALVRSGSTAVEFLDLGSHRLRDLSEPERVWQVVHPDLPGDFPPVRGVDTFAHNLPTQRTTLIGRDREVLRVISLVRSHRIVTLTGVGGVGKTRLAVQAAADLLSQFSNVWFVELGSVADPDDVADAIAVALGIAAAGDPLTAATTMLSSERTLLVIDNCEHVVDSAAEVVDTLTSECPELSIIATSREALGIDGEHVMPVRSLDPTTTATELFRQRAVAAGADLTTLDRTQVEQLCRRLDGIPLAIELAAARAASLGLAALVGSLDDRFSLLSSGRRRAVDRHSTMRATIDWSYRLLHPDEQRLFQWLSMFTNGFELDALVHVAGCLGLGELAATEHLATLLAKSMVAAEPTATGVRYRMLETMRAFGQEQLDHHGERMAASMAIAEWVTTISDLPFDEFCNAAVERNSIRLEREADAWRDSMILAARLGSCELAARLCGPPAAFFLLGRHDLADFVRPVADLCTAEPLRRRALLCALMVSAAGATEPALLRSWADEMEAIDALEPTGIAGVMRWLALLWCGDVRESVAVCAAASRDARFSQSTRDFFLGIAVLGHYSLIEGEADGERFIERALETGERSEVAMARATCLLGAAWGLAETEPDAALRLVTKALANIPDVAALTRLTLPGNASRLLSSLDPKVAALGLLEQLDAVPSRQTFVDFIPLCYAADVLQRVGHPAADGTVASVAMSSSVTRPTMMEVVALARRASSTSTLIALTQIESTVRSALIDIAAGVDWSVNA